MSRQTEERNRQKFAEKMRQKTLAAKAKASQKKELEHAAPAAGTDDSKKD